MSNRNMWLKEINVGQEGSRRRYLSDRKRGSPLPKTRGRCVERSVRRELRSGKCENGGGRAGPLLLQSMLSAVWSHQDDTV